MDAEPGQHVVQIEGGEFAVLPPLEAGAGGQGDPGITGGPAQGGEIHGVQVHGEAEMCWFQD